MDTIKKVAKIVSVIVAVAAAIAGIYVLVTKLCAKKNEKCVDEKENYVSCSCLDADFVSEQVK